jgi:general secretion pathway protein G
MKNVRTIGRLRRGFSLIELLLVLVILSVLAAIVVPKFTGVSEKARVTKAESEIANMGTALSRFEIEVGRFPTSEEGLQALVTSPGGLPEGKWAGPYLEKGVPKDPWGNAYVYRYPGANNLNGYDLYSMGPDGRDGNDDITNWQAK